MLQNLGLELVLTLPNAPESYDRHGVRVLTESSPCEFRGIPSFSKISVRRIDNKECVASHEQRTHNLLTKKTEAHFSFHWITPGIKREDATCGSPALMGLPELPNWFLHLQIHVEFEQHSKFQCVVVCSPQILQFGNETKYVIEATRNNIRQLQQQLECLEAAAAAERPCKKNKSSL